ncbi:hypothetical protein TSTA_019550 [Talaromyces stipitatus ATCC 10500]|uniref:Sugar transporter n=1 Tax=Talaromyces stipitatus (strain ATCC 10500 / CBS 375.48 / QM 6759 / NRRL 1006) TaxID=441959 RepID=B8MH79_TALSN|nr:uncharacterized protein TSTA_019550 [Talaromyces stipitatus ATCC 10500]EED16893.1 hypothetical protein TSTA_019550 [Talaromyces stipitatus ATCC 10500]
MLFTFIILKQISPKAIRGLLILQYAACQMVGVAFGLFINYGVAKSYTGTNKHNGCSPPFYNSSQQQSGIRHLPADHPLILSEIKAIEIQILHEVEPDSPTIFGYLGVKGTESTLLAPGIYAIVKFVSTMLFGIFVMDFIGRSRSLMTGICLQIVTLAYYQGTPCASRASTGAIVAIYFQAVAWSIGRFSIPYVLGPEIFPIPIRSLNMSISMAFHWLFYFASSRETSSLLAAMEKWSAFVFYGFICTVFFARLDTTGKSIEALASLFRRPWYTVWRVAYPTANEKQEVTDDPKSNVDHVEKV